MRYLDFLASKSVEAPLRGMPSPPDLAPHLFEFQRVAVDFGLRVGSWGLFFDTGLGKTACELEWSKVAAAESNGRALILAPLAVAWQIEAEGRRWGYDVRVIREQSEASDGINVCNYDRIEKLDPDAFGSVALDESSILKSFSGKTARALIAMFERHRWRMAASATPAPNDHMEIGQQSEFLGILSQSEMLVRWFINDSFDASKTWRLKGHAVSDFWDWMASWSRMASHPRDLGDDVPGFDLPELRIIRHRAAGEVKYDGLLFGPTDVSATEMHDLKRQTAKSRAEVVAEQVHASREPWLVWCDTDYEADALTAALGREGVVEVRGSHPVERKEESLLAFLSGQIRVLVTKPSICGWGLNFQHCARMAFVGRTFSYESWYQAVRRCWRFGQQREVEVHIVVADGEEAIGRVLDRKSEDHERMKSEMTKAMKRAMGQDSMRRAPYNPNHDGELPRWIAA